MTQPFFQTRSRNVFCHTRATLLLCSTAILMLSACSDSGMSHGTTTSLPPAALETGDSIAPITVPDTAAADGTKAVDTIQPIETIAPIPTPMETFRALAPEQGLKVTPLFSTSAGSEDARIKRIEDAVQGVRNDIDTIMPTMVRMATMESDMRELVDRLQNLTDGGAAEAKDPPESATEEQPVAENMPLPLSESMLATPAKNTDEANGIDTMLPIEASILDEADWIDQPELLETKSATAKAAQAKPEQQQSKPESDAPDSAKPAILGVRIGDHAEMTRLVLDMNASAKFQATINSTGNTITIPVPDMVWSGAMEKTVKSGKLISSYKYENGILTLSLSHMAQIKAEQILPPDGTSTFRYVLDLIPAASE